MFQRGVCPHLMSFAPISVGGHLSPNSSPNISHSHLVVNVSPFQMYVHNLKNFFFKDSLNIRGREGNGTPLQYSCLENPMDRGAW